MRNLWLFVVLAAAVLLVALVVFFVPVIRGGWTRLSSGRVPAQPSARANPAARTNPLVRGFGYLYVTPRFTRHRHNVQDRMSRAFQRIDAVDPDSAPRRIGLAMMQAGLVDAPTWPGPAPDPGAPWGEAREFDEPGETR